jgi:hypothetical protein
MAVEVEMPKFQNLDFLLLQKVGKGTKRKAAHQHEGFEVRHSLESVEEIGVGRDVGRVRVAINRNA